MQITEEIKLDMDLIEESILDKLVEAIQDFREGEVYVSEISISAVIEYTDDEVSDWNE